MRIADVDLSKQTLMIAEVGVNHEGDFDAARHLLQLAADAKADAVKFQAYYIRELRYISPFADPERFERSQRNELTLDQFRQLAQDAQVAGVMFLCTCFDPETVEALSDVLPAFKIASGDVTNVPLLRAIGRTRKPVILSTGMAVEQQIERALVELAGDDDLETAKARTVLLQCTSSYPCPPEQAQLRAMDWLTHRFGCRVGYSDHTLGTLACQAAVARGACVIEKHFTDQKIGRTFRDHAMSVEPDEFRELVEVVRQTTVLLGSGGKQVQPGERDSMTPARRSIGVRRDLPAGTVLSEDMLVALRPASGWPMRPA